MWDQQFKSEKILVKEEKLHFECYAIADDHISNLPGHLRVAASASGSGLFCDVDWRAGEIIFEEEPLMIVANHGGDSNFEARWQMYFAIENDRGPRSKVIKAFNEFADGGRAFVAELKGDGKELFKKALASSGRSNEEVDMFFKGMPDFVEEESMRIAGVLARWNSNSHDFATCGQDQSCLFQYCAKMNHSCDPNITLQIDKDTGTCIARASKPIQAGEELFISYMGESPKFAKLCVVDRRAKLSARGFVCICSRCKEESK